MEKATPFVVKLLEKMDSDTVPAFTEKVNEQIEGLDKETEVILDMEDTIYISSIALRMIQRIHKAYPKCVCVNVRPEVYETLEMVGFTSFLNIRRIPMQIPPVEGEPIARGSNGQIYSIGGDTIVKMFTEKTQMPEIEEEWAKARTAVSLGIPSVICYAVVNDGTRNGIMFEKLQTKTLDRLIYEDYENFDKYADMFARLFREIHETRDVMKELSSVKDQQIALVDRALYLSEKEREDLKNFLNDFPDSDTVVHGDFHPRNIGTTEGELIAMDMAEIGYGNPVFDFMSTYYDLVFSGKNFPEVTKFFFGLEIPDLRRLWDRMLQTYFGGLSKEEADFINEMMDDLVGFRTILLPVLHPNNTKEKHAKWTEIGRNCLDGKLEELSKKVKIFDTDYLHR